MPPFLAVAVLLGVLAGSTTITGQDQAATAPDRLRVYLDCDDCFETYLRDEIRWVDFVRDPAVAEIHVFVDDNETGGGGREYAIRVVGSGRFQGADDTFRSAFTAGESEDRLRQGVRDTMSIGLLRHIARDGFPEGLTLSVEPSDAQPNVQPASDPWNLWVFSLSGSGSLEAEESRRESNWQAGISIDRVAENWLVSIGTELEQQTERFNLDEDEPLSTTTRSRTFDWIVVKSLGEHWSAGTRGSLNSSTFGNTKLSFTAAPAVEFNVFPYSSYNRRQLRIEYALGARYSRYNEITVFGELRESLPEHRLSATLEQREPWGTLETGVVWSQFLHDPSKNRLEGEGELALRIARGLSVDLEGNVSRIRDQLSLPRRAATPEELLLQLRELQSGYDVRFEVGLTYTFGSIFNNIVNPRFGGRGR